MEPLKPRCSGDQGPEAKIQKAIIKMLKQKGWYVKRMAASAYMFGVPDLFACHRVFGHRWIEVKLPGMKGSKFTAAQLIDFPLICSHGSGVWILTGDTQREYEKLKAGPNWYHYLKL